MPSELIFVVLNFVIATQSRGVALHKLWCLLSLRTVGCTAMHDVLVTPIIYSDMDSISL